MTTRGTWRLRAEGRGRNYSLRRGVIESVLRVVYAHDWPAVLWSRMRSAGRVDCIRLAFPWPDGGTRPSLTVGFVSDLHLGPTTAATTLDAAFDHLAHASLDVLLLGGDYVFLDATPAKAAELARRVAAVPARTKLAVMGNHDLWTEHGLLERALADAGATVLDNRAMRLPAPHGGVAVVGLDEVWTGTPDPDAAVRSAGNAAVRLGLCHAPEGAPLLARRGVSVMFCGHTHGGHLALPGGRPVVVPGPCGKRWPHGVHDVDGMALVVSRGVGGVEVPMRTWAEPDVVVATFGGAAG